MQPALLIVLIGTSYLLLAGGPAWTAVPIGALAALTALAAPRRTFSFPAFARTLDLALVALAAAIALQLLPLPVGVVNAISPHAMPLRAATRLEVTPRTWVPLSIDEEATAQALGTVAIGIVAFWIARGVFSAGGSTRQCCRALSWMSAVFALVALVQKAVRPGLLMGVVATGAPNANPMGPFTNRNHFAAWLLMASAAVFGYLIAHLQIHPAYRQRFGVALRHFLASGALLSGVCALIAVSALLMTLSRSAAAGLGFAAVCGAWLGRARLQIGRTGLPRMLGLAGVALLFVAAFIDAEGWFTRMRQSLGYADSNFDRLTIWRESLPIIRDFFLTGTGAGTYGQAMAHYQQSRIWIGAMHGWAFFNNAHSHYVQLAGEGGLLLVVPAAVAMTALARLGLRAVRADKGEMFWVRIGAAAGVAGIGFQGIWEVPLIMPANAILFGTLAGLLIFRRGADHHRC